MSDRKMGGKTEKSLIAFLRMPFHCGGTEASFGGIQSGAISAAGEAIILSTPPGFIYFLLEVQHEGLPVTENSRSISSFTNELTDLKLICHQIKSNRQQIPKTTGSMECPGPCGCTDSELTETAKAPCRK